MSRTLDILYSSFLQPFVTFGLSLVYQLYSNFWSFFCPNWPYNGSSDYSFMSSHCSFSLLLTSLLMWTEFCYSIFIYFSTPALKLYSVFFFLSTKAVQIGTVTNTCSSNRTNLTVSFSALGHFPFLCLLVYTLLTSSLLSNALFTIQPFYASGWSWASKVIENWGFLILLPSLSTFTANLMQL